MSPIENLLFLVGIPLLLVVVLSTMIWSRSGAHPATYTMSEPWAQTHPPILWAAVDERIGGHAGSKFSVGGGASGKW